MPGGSTPGGGTPGGSVPNNAGSGSAPKRRRTRVESKLNFNEIVKMLYRGRWIILATFVLFFAYAVYDIYNKPFIYAASTRMLVEKPAVSEKELGPMFAAREDHSIANQIQFFKSHVVAEHVARVIHKLAHGDRGEIDSLFTEYFGNPGAVPPDTRQLALIRIEENPKLPHIEGVADFITIKNRVQAAANIFQEPNNDYLAVSAEAYTPLDAALIVNTYVCVFAKDNLARLRQNNVALKDFLNTQKSRSQDTLHKIERQLHEKLREGYTFDVQGRQTDLIRQYEEVKLNHANKQIALKERRKILDDLTANLDSAQRTFLDNLVREPFVARLQGEIADFQFEIENMKTQNAIMNPRTKKYLQDDITAKEERLAALKEKLRENADYLLNKQLIIISDVDNNANQQSSTISSSQAVTRLREAILSNKLKIGQDELVIQELENLMLRIQDDMLQLPEVMARMGELERAQGSAERIYSQMEAKYMDAWFSEQSVFSNIKVEDPAGLNAAPIRPNRQASVFTGSLIGLAVGVVIVVLLSMLDSTIRSPEELESHNLNVLAAIPVIESSVLQSAEANSGDHTDRPKFTPHRVSHLDSRSSIAESYRSLRTNLQFAGLDRPIQTMTVSSSAPQEGKSTTSSNLGIVMAQMGKRTLIVDTDLRRPVLHSVFGIKREPGLTNVLFDRTALNEAIHKTDVPNLYVLPCGIIPPNPSELLGSEKMNQLIQTLKQEFDFIIFDTPPVVAVTDALLLGMQTDAMIIIARADVSKADGVLRAVEAVERSNIRFLGVVLNNFNLANAYGAYYRYYQYYHYYSNEGPPQSGLMQKVNAILGRTKRAKASHDPSHDHQLRRKASAKKSNVDV
ncbi:MAG TPA: polysaccharide biosynthesis tyrosine autokinase [Candidatus Kapabacteria bacterium]|nr:polysaccharide biosynthesis tyrosine autokinase [Candidatus Kapabacteria bacterium]